MPDHRAAPEVTEMDVFSADIVAVEEEALSSGLKSGDSRTRTAQLARKDYMIGIGLLLIVVILWTSSNFVTQVRHHSLLNPLPL
jgi:hypothetical protein